MPIWILGSSLFGAQLAAMLGLPYSFAAPAFAQPFDWPAKGIMSGTFGSQRIDNGKPMAPHFGVEAGMVAGDFELGRPFFRQILGLLASWSIHNRGPVSGLSQYLPCERRTLGEADQEDSRV